MSEYFALHWVLINNVVIYEMHDAIQFWICIFFLRLNSNLLPYDLPVINLCKGKCKVVPVLK
jgi:hypothetical protein